MLICGSTVVSPTLSAREVALDRFWQRPDDLAERDLVYGTWGREHAPDPTGTYTIVKPELTGVNPRIIVRDVKGRLWNVEQPRHDRKAEGQMEVVVSRVLSAVGYFQPPVYFLPSFTAVDHLGTRIEPGGRFRLDHPALEERGEWSWQQNPFLGTRPYRGLLVIMILFNSSDFKDSHNFVYEYRRSPDQIERWFVVRDLGPALGSTDASRSAWGDLTEFERQGFIADVKDGFVEFDHHGLHQEVIRQRITPEDVRWASALLSGLTDEQWHEAFRAGGYGPAPRQRFITRLLEKIREGLRIGERVPR
jgi:hypothetical protein